VGTAFVLANRGIAGDTLIFEEKAGLVRMELLRDGGTVVGAGLTAPQPLSRGAEVPANVVAAACSVGGDDIETARHQPCVASCGTSFIFAELKTRQALATARPRIDVFVQHLPIEGASGI